MINLMISGRRPQGQTLDEFYNEFESTHVDLMRQARCERFIKRYTQNKTIQNLPPIELWAARDTHVDSQASLAFEDLNGLSGFFNDPDYNQLVKSHQFTDPNYMTFDLSEETKIKTGEVTKNAVKVIYYLKPQVGITRDEFRTLIDGPFSDFTVNAKKEFLSSHMRFYCFPENLTQFMKEAFQKARVSEFGIIDELWFQNLDDLRRFHQGLKEKVHLNFDDAIDFKKCFSLVTTDRVVFGTR
jgi:hypothetical protein